MCSGVALDVQAFGALFGCFVIVAFNVHAMDDVAVPADHVSSIGVHECALLTSAIAARPLCSTENAGATKQVQRSVWYLLKKALAGALITPEPPAIPSLPTARPFKFVSVSHYARGHPP